MSLQDVHKNAEQMIDGKVSQFRKQVDKINNSDNPYYKDPEVREYEIANARKELEQEVKELNDDFNAQADAAIEQAEQKAATSFLRTSHYDEQTAQETLNGYLSDVLLAYNEKGKSEAGAQLENRLEHFNEQQLAAVRKLLPSAIQQAQGDEKAMKQLRSINSTLSQLQTSEQQELSELQSLKENKPDASFRRLTMTHGAFKDYSHNRNGTGIGKIR